MSVEIHDGDVISVIGPCGTGKSTLLRCINLLEKPTEGHIWVNDVDVTDPKCDLGKVRQKMGMVFQSFNLFGHLILIADRGMYNGTNMCHVLDQGNGYIVSKSLKKTAKTERE